MRERQCENWNKEIHFNTLKNLLITSYKSFHAPRFVFICKHQEEVKSIKILHRKSIFLLARRDLGDGVSYHLISSQKSSLYAFNVFLNFNFSSSFIRIWNVDASQSAADKIFSLLFHLFFSRLLLLPFVSFNFRLLLHRHTESS